MAPQEVATAPELSPRLDPVLLENDRGQRFRRGSGMQRPVLIMVIFVLAQDPPLVVAERAHDDGPRELTGAEIAGLRFFGAE